MRYGLRVAEINTLRDWSKKSRGVDQSIWKWSDYKTHDPPLPFGTKLSDDPPLNEGWKLRDRPPIKRDIF